MGLPDLLLILVIIPLAGVYVIVLGSALKRKGPREPPRWLTEEEDE
jgi:hypothetical protein